MQNRQIRILYREFLFRIVDLDLLSAYAQGDTSRLLGQFAALLIFVSLLFSIPALGFGGANLPDFVRLQLAWNMQHFLIATTMLVVGLFAVLSWESLFPDRRDVMVLAPLPVGGGTLFVAKVAAVGTALAVTVLTLHAACGIFWPLSLNQTSEPHDAPAYKTLPPSDLASSLPREAAYALKPGTGVAIGVYNNGVRRIFTFGNARADSIFEVGSVSKVFTGLLLARLVEDGRVRLDEPIRPGTAITFRDLVTHRAGLPRMPSNLRPEDRNNPYPEYHVADLWAYLAARGPRKPPAPSFYYSNTGYSLLGHALAELAGVSYESLLKRITGPLRMPDTAVALTPQQRSRFLTGHDAKLQPIAAPDMDGFAPAGGIRSTVPDMLAFLEAQLQPAGAIARSQQPLADIVPGVRIAMGWVHDRQTGVYWANGATGGYGSHVFFDPVHKRAAVVLINRFPMPVVFPEILGEHIRQQLAGEPAWSAETVRIPAGGGLLRLPRTFASYWITLLSAAVFILCSVLSLQGLAQLLPRQIYLRVSSILQIAAFCLFLSIYVIQPIAVNARSLSEAQSQGLLAWSPTYWFLGLFQQLNGSPALPVLASRAWIGLAFALAGSAAAYALCYLRTMRMIIEQPDITPSTHFALPAAGSVVQFAVRTLLRSRQHRMIYAFYTGIAIAIAIYFLKTPRATEQVIDGNPWQSLNVPLIGSIILIVCFAIVGARVVFAMPFEMQANWIFRVTDRMDGHAVVKARRRALLLLGLAPAFAVCAAGILYIGPWREALAHLALLAFIGLIAVEICLAGTPKLPFTCSYLPGKSNVHITFWFCIMLIVRGIEEVARLQLHLVSDVRQLMWAFAVLGVLLALARWRTSSAIDPSAPPVEFEDVPSDAIVSLDIGRG